MADIEESTAVEAPEVEVKAKSMGWVPKDEFKGDPDKWRDAGEFVSRGENFLGILRDDNRKLRAEVADVRETLKLMVAHNERLTKRQYERELKDLQAKKEEAIELGDKVQVREIEKGMLDLEAVKPVAVPQQQVQPSQEDIRMFEQFKTDNPWYLTEPEMTSYANLCAVHVEKTKPHLVGTPKYYDAVLERVKKEFPDRFTNPRRSDASAVSSGNDTSGSGKKGRNYSELPPEAKLACDKFVKQIPGYTRDQYVKEYFGE